MNNEVIDDFLPKNNFKQLQKFVMESPAISWSYNTKIEGFNTDGEQIILADGSSKMTGWVQQDYRLSYFVHVLFDQFKILSDHFGLILPILAHPKIQAKALLRSKINLYPHHDTLNEHGTHKDYPFPHKTALLALNTCDGYTKLEDEIKIESVENRMLLFDSSNPHASTDTSNSTARFNININYF